MSNALAPPRGGSATQPPAKKQRAGGGSGSGGGAAQLQQQRQENVPGSCSSGSGHVVLFVHRQGIAPATYAAWKKNVAAALGGSLTQDEGAALRSATHVVVPSPKALPHSDRGLRGWDAVPPSLRTPAMLQKLQYVTERWVASSIMSGAWQPESAYPPLEERPGGGSSGGTTPEPSHAPGAAASAPLPVVGLSPGLSGGAAGTGNCFAATGGTSSGGGSSEEFAGSDACDSSDEEEEGDALSIPKWYSTRADQLRCPAQREDPAQAASFAVLTWNVWWVTVSSDSHLGCAWEEGQPVGPSSSCSSLHSCCYQHRCWPFLSQRLHLGRQHAGVL